MKTKISTLVLLSTLFFMGCLQSPLLNHADASNVSKLDQSENKECPLAFPTQKLCAKLDWTVEPSEENEGEFTLKFWAQDQIDGEKGPYVDPGYSVFVKLWMPSMGHGSRRVKVSALKDAEGKELVGEYLASEVFFVMGGEWEIWVQLKDQQKVIEQAKIDIEI